MKALGAAAILAASLMAALCVLREDRRRVGALRALAASLLALRAELADRQTALPEAFRRLAESSRGERARAFFSRLSRRMERLGEVPFSVLWSESVGQELSTLGAEETDRLAALGALLGGCELSEQCDALKSCAEALERSAAQYAARRAEKRRMALGLSLCLGAFVIIILL